MNIIIPLAGHGQRFVEDGYTAPKPLIPVLGDPLIFHVLRCLKISSDDQIYIPHSPDIDMAVVKKEFPSVHLIPLAFSTRGAAETVLCALNQMPDTRLQHPTLVMDGDTFYRDDIIKMAEEVGDTNAIFYFIDDGEESIYSYIQYTPNVLSSSKVSHWVSDIQEKRRISNYACSGAYFFRNGELLKRTCEVALQGTPTIGEYYMSGLYSLLLSGGEKVAALEIKSFQLQCLGTPNQLKAYCMRRATKTSRGHEYKDLAPNIQEYYKYDKKRFCFDLDNTLCTSPDVAGDYGTVRPKFEQIDRLKYLHSIGHTIIIQTARGMKSCKGDSGKATAKVHKEVFCFLSQYAVPYDEIYFGKPHADFYIDDLAVPANGDVDKAIGFYNGTVEPRVFNQVVFEEDIYGGGVTKTTNNPGEIYWYQNIPSSIKNHFPHLQAVDGNKIHMDRIDGVPLSYLFVNKSLTTADIDFLLGTMAAIHSSAGLLVKTELIYGNYWPKVQERYDDNMGAYHQAAGESQKAVGDVLWQLEYLLKEYESKGLGRAGVVHGDPVFSNIFLCSPRSLKFIDMRGRVGEELTIYGDIFYDYAKVYQSLVGYDYILLDRPNSMSEYNTTLMRHFEDRIMDRFGAERMKWIRTLTASMLFSLIPLHTDTDKQKRYFKLAETLLF